MRHDMFEYHGLTVGEKAWRIVFLLAVICVLLMDLFYWRAG